MRVLARASNHPPRSVITTHPALTRRPGATHTSWMGMTTFCFVFLALALDAPGESGGFWQSPLAPLGAFLTENLNKSVPISALTFPLSAVILLGLSIAGIASRRSVRRSLPAPLHNGIFVAMATVCALIAWGLVTGGDIQMAKNQVQNYLLLLLTGIVTAECLARGASYRTLGTVVVAAACIKAAMALWVASMVLPDRIKALDGHFATTHGDSLLFVGAVTILSVRFVERPQWRHNRALLALPLLCAAMVANNRRLAWVELSCAAVTVCSLGPQRLRRQVGRAALIAAVPLAVYVGVGWQSNSSVFAPIKVFQSVQDGEGDSSTLFRDIENYNLIRTAQKNPFVGSGFGHPFDEVVKNFDISFFKEYYFLPHNSVLALWAFTGAVGFTGLWQVFVIGSFMAARGYRYARTRHERTAALTALIMVLIYQIQCWGDIGFNEKRAIFLVGPALAVAGHIALATGAWRTDGLRRAAPSTSTALTSHVA